MNRPCFHKQPSKMLNLDWIQHNIKESIEKKKRRAKGVEHHKCKKKNEIEERAGSYPFLYDPDLFYIRHPFYARRPTPCRRRMQTLWNSECRKKTKKKHGEIERRELEYSIGRRLALKIDM